MHQAEAQVSADAYTETWGTRDSPAPVPLYCPVPGSMLTHDSMGPDGGQQGTWGLIPCPILGGGNAGQRVMCVSHSEADQL